MKSHRISLLQLCVGLLIPSLVAGATPVVRMDTVVGEIFVELTPDVAPATVENFLNYVERGDYDGSFVHRADPGFVIQGGGFFFDETTGAAPGIPADPPVLNEFNVSNLRGTIAMARLGGQPNSATTQWFINLGNNTFLDTVDGGFTVFGNVRSTGMTVADNISMLPLCNCGGAFGELPTIDFDFTSAIVEENLVVIRSVEEFELLPPPFGAVLPGGRSVQVNQTASAFATLINSGQSTAASCGLRPTSAVAADFSFQTTDADNQPIGVENARVDIGPGAAQSFVFTFTPTESFDNTTVELEFACGNADPAGVLAGVNTFSLSASTMPTADVIALAATASGDGITSIPGNSATAAFSVATVNVGVAQTITVSADTGGVDLPVNVFVCETDPATAACLGDLALSIEVTLDANQASTFSFFIQGNGNVKFAPATNRVFARFQDASGSQRGATSVAILTVE